MTPDQIICLLALLADLQADKVRLTAEVTALQAQVVAALKEEAPDGVG